MNTFGENYHTFSKQTLTNSCDNNIQFSVKEPPGTLITDKSRRNSFAEMESILNSLQQVELSSTESNL